MLSRSCVSVAVQAALSVGAPLYLSRPTRSGIPHKAVAAFGFWFGNSAAGHDAPIRLPKRGFGNPHLANTTHPGCSQGQLGARHCSNVNIKHGSSLPCLPDGAADLAEVAMRRFPPRVDQKTGTGEVDHG